MAHIKVIIDGTTAMDADTGEWTTTPAELSKLQQAAPKTPGLMGLLTEFTQIALADQPGTYDLTHTGRDWTLSYTEQ